MLTEQEKDALEEFILDLEDRCLPADVVTLGELAKRDGAEWEALVRECLAQHPNPRPLHPQAPIAKVCVGEDDSLLCMLYAPGLPPGEYDLYCEPERVAPYIRAQDAVGEQHG